MLPSPEPSQDGSVISVLQASPQEIVPSISAVKPFLFF